MRLRHLIALTKIKRQETSWSTGPLPPRHAPIYKRSYPIRAGWKWRSVHAVSEETGTGFVMFALANTARGNWKATLIMDGEGGPSVVARLEDHSSHSGLHAHAHCERGGLEIGVSGMDGLPRIPPARRRHRRAPAWTDEAFWRAARRFFRIDEPSLPLFDDEA